MSIIVAAILLSLLNFPANVMAGESSASNPAKPKIESVRVGLSNHYRMGTWTPIAVELSALSSSRSLRIEVIASDSDGVPTTVTAALPPTATSPLPRRAVAYTQIGRIHSPIRVILWDGEEQLDERALDPRVKSTARDAIAPIPANGELILQLGSGQIGLKDAFRRQTSDGNHATRAVVEIQDLAELPVEWYGYDAAHIVVIAASDIEFCQSLASDQARFSALQRWVANGGRLVFFCGGANAKTLLAADHPFATLAPGKFADIVRMPDAVAVESFVASAPRIAGVPLHVPRLLEVEGRIESHAGRRQTDLPLVVRSPRGFGEVAFVAVDFDAPPLAKWPGRSAFLQALLRPYLADLPTSETPQLLATTGVTDLSGALRQQLGRSFASVTAIGFPAITGLTIAYLLVLGPLDYLIVHRWLRRPLAAWVTFPLIVLVFAAASLAIGNWSRGSRGSHVNRLCLVDIDTISKQSRGTLWTALFTPDARRFNLAVKSPETPNPQNPPRDTSVLFSWWGLPGRGIGGMQAGGSDLGIIQRGYFFGPRLTSLEELPILASGTKSLIARWDSNVSSTVASELADADELLTGFIINETEMQLRNVRLLYGSWGYQLGNLNPGQQIDITDELSPRHAKTILTRDALAASGATAAQVDGRVFSAEEATPKQILNLMMFYDAAGGTGFAHVPNRVQSQIDLSRQLELGRAVLVADVRVADATLVDQETGETLDRSDNEPSSVYRFILPVNKPAAP